MAADDSGAIYLLRSAYDGEELEASSLDVLLALVEAKYDWSEVTLDIVLSTEDDEEDISP